MHLSTSAQICNRYKDNVNNPSLDLYATLHLHGAVLPPTEPVALLRDGDEVLLQLHPDGTYLSRWAVDLTLCTPSLSKDAPESSDARQPMAAEQDTSSREDVVPTDITSPAAPPRQPSRSARRKALKRRLIREARVGCASTVHIATQGVLQPRGGRVHKHTGRESVHREVTMHSLAPKHKQHRLAEEAVVKGVERRPGHLVFADSEDEADDGYDAMGDEADVADVGDEDVQEGARWCGCDMCCLSTCAAGTAAGMPRVAQRVQHDLLPPCTAADAVEGAVVSYRCATVLVTHTAVSWCATSFLSWLSHTLKACGSMRCSSNLQAVGDGR